VTRTNLRQPIEERELELALREAELNRRESALRRAEEVLADNQHAPLYEVPVQEAHVGRATSALEAELEAGIAAAQAKERELERTIGAVEAQRDRLDAVRMEYETRRDALKDRTLEVEAERDRLRTEQARLVTASMELDDRERATAALELTVEAAPPSKPKPTDADWWAKQLGAPLEAA
jgi:chromosome segregation ATPase